MNRVDDIVVFKGLAKELVKNIAALLLQQLNDRLEKQIKMHLTWDDKALNLLAEQGFDPAFGARPLRRLLSHTVETELSKSIIKGDVSEGDTVAMTVENGQLVFNKK